MKIIKNDGSLTVAFLILVQQFNSQLCVLNSVEDLKIRLISKCWIFKDRFKISDDLKSEGNIGFLIFFDCLNF